MNLNKLIVIVICLLCATNLFAQSISFNFPHFAGYEWYMTAFRGDGKDTITVGTLDEQGKAKITLPENYRHHRGMTQWLLRKGGGLDIIIANEDNISVSCTEAQPSEENIIYTNSRENTYLLPRYHRQQAILGKIDAMRMAAEAYKDDDNNDLLSNLNTELQKQERAYNQLQQETVAENMYAARFAQIVDVTRGLPPVLSSDQKDMGKPMKDFVLNDLDMNDLYNSGHWSNVLDQFFGWYSYEEDNRGLLIADVIRLLHRTQSDEIYAALAEKVIVSCEKQNWHDQEIELAFFLLNDDRIKSPSGKIASLYTLLKVRKGSKAPQLTQGTLPKKKTILAFYDSGCGSCTAQMMKLAELYPKLQKQDYEVVSLSADSDKELFDRYAEKLPWKAKYCDFMGFAGKDFLNYGIMGTPTFYLLDKKGIVQGRYARVEDIDIQIK